MEERKTDMDPWIKSLNELYESCVPLTFEDNLTQEQIEKRNGKIIESALECVKHKNTDQSSCVYDDPWVTSLCLLYVAVDPLTWDCLDIDHNDTLVKYKNIEHHTIYCMHVKGAIEDGITPLSYDEWDEKVKNFNVSAKAGFYVPKRPLYDEKMAQKEITNQINDSFKVGMK